MNKKGFTLVELLAVIVILGLLAIITTPAYESISNSIKTSEYNSKKNTIKSNLKVYIEKYMKDIVKPNNGNKTICFTVNYLIQNGIVISDSETDEYIKNDVTNDKYEDSYVYAIAKYDSENLKVVINTFDEVENVNNLCDNTYD